jgi:hypothetical protein
MLTIDGEILPAVAGGPALSLLRPQPMALSRFWLLQPAAHAK